MGYVEAWLAQPFVDAVGPGEAIGACFATCFE